MILDRLLESFRALVRAELARLTYYGAYEYAVTEARVDEATGLAVVTGVPLGTASLPPLVDVALRPGLPGTVAVPIPGSTAIVAFVNADPTRPYVLAFDGVPCSSIKIGGGLAARVPAGEELGRFVRYGDLVELPVVGSAAKGPLVQQTATTPNLIGRVSG